jgi:uncharacterized protein (TIGR02285 family)
MSIRFHPLPILLILVLFLTGLFISPSSSRAEERLVWLKFDYPPLYIAQGDYTGQGILDVILDRIITALPEYRHEIRFVNLSRAMSELERGKNLCTAALFHSPQRERIGLFSQNPTTFLSSLKLVVRKGEEERFSTGSKNPPPLSDLLTDSGLHLGVSANMSYGESVDSAIKEVHNPEDVFVRGGKDIGKGLLEMVLKKRIDFTIGYPWSVTTILNQAQLKRLSFLPFAEAEKRPMHFVFCVKNDWGAAMIRRIDAVLSTEEAIIWRREAIERWIPADSKLSFRQDYSAWFRGSEK